jgi:hypothetical protein
MARQVVSEPNAQPDPWGGAPVTVGHHRHHHRLGWAIMLLLLVAATAIALLLTSTAPTPAPAPPSTPAPTVTPASPSVPFDLAMEVADVTAMDDDGLFGLKATIPQGAADTATQEITDVLERYLDAEFVTPETRFSAQPLSDLLSRNALDALSDDDLAGLGVLGISVRQVRAERAVSTARVLTSGSDVALVTVRYAATAWVVTDDGASVPLHQRAEMVFVPQDGGWRAEAVDATLELPPAGGEPR